MRSLRTATATAWPASVICTVRPLTGPSDRVTQPASSIRLMICVMLGALTPSAVASSPTVLGPPRKRESTALCATLTGSVSASRRIAWPSVRNRLSARSIRSELTISASHPARGRRKLLCGRTRSALKPSGTPAM